MIEFIKRKFGLVSRQDFEQALANITDAKDREDFVWKLTMKLFNERR